MRTANGTYVYCVIVSARPPRLTRVPRGLPGTGPVRLLDVERGLYIVAADAPLHRYGGAAINRRLSDLDWVSRAAVAHEAVVESFVDARAVLPMKLFTIFTGDARAVEDVRAQRARIVAVAKRVANQHEWGVRVVLDRVAAARGRRRQAQANVRTGLDYLARKKARRDAAVELAERARDTVAALYDRLASRSRQARRRAPAELPADGGPLILDAAFLVPRTRSAAFRALAAREARALAAQGYALTISGPWPPYTFVQD